MAREWSRILLRTLLLLAGGALILVLTSYIGLSYENIKMESLQQDAKFLTVLIAFISAAVISLVYEEIFYRGFMYRWLRKRIGVRWGI